MNTPCSEFKRTEEKTTHFGYRQVREEEKARLVAEVFHSVAQRYDVMNDLMSFGLHRLWKEQTLAAAGLRCGHCVLDVASGTGDLARSCAEAVGEEGLVLMTDINESMLKIGRDRLIDAGIIKQVAYAVSDAEHLAFTDNYFDRVMIAFGLRNVTHKEQALKSMYRVLKPGGKLLVLEFSQPQSNLLSRIYDFYSFQCIPVIGEWVAKDRESYQYLVESIRLHPPQEKLKMMLAEAGFEDVTYTNWSGGIVALHQGYKY